MGNKTCDFEKENDPTLLRSPSTGKLLQYTVDDGAHVYMGHSYAEIEVTPVTAGPSTVFQSFLILILVETVADNWLTVFISQQTMGLRLKLALWGYAPSCVSESERTRTHTGFSHSELEVPWQWIKLPICSGSR